MSAERWNEGERKKSRSREGKTAEYRGPSEAREPPIPEGPCSTKEEEYKRQKTEKKEERNRAPREEIVLEQGVENGAGRTTREKVEDEFNAACWECGSAFDERKLYLQHCRVAHGGLIGTKGA